MEPARGDLATCIPGKVSAFMLNNQQIKLIKGQARQQGVCLFEQPALRRTILPGRSTSIWFIPMVQLRGAGADLKQDNVLAPL